MMKARVFITLKPAVLDPQGKAIQNALNGLGFDEAQSVRQGKVIDIELSGDDNSAVQSSVTEMCEKLLANTVIEDYRIEILQSQEVQIKPEVKKKEQKMAFDNKKEIKMLSFKEFVLDESFEK